jgi:hypothetical protein
MLGLGNSLVSGGGSFGMSSPLDFSGCKLWLRHNTGVSADLDSSSGAIDHSTDAGDMADGDKIDGWADQSGEDNHAVQDTGTDAPLWIDASSSVNFASSKYMDLSASISESSNSDFTFVFRGTASSISTNMGFFGNSSTDFWRINSSGKVMRTKIGGSSASDFTESTALETDVLYTFTLTRSGGDGTLEIRVDGGSSTVRSDHQWGGTTRTDADTFTVSNLGSAADDSGGWRGIVKHAIYYNVALTTDQRNQLQDWLKNND